MNKVIIKKQAMKLYKEFFGVSMPTEEIVDDLQDFLLEEPNRDKRALLYDIEIGCYLYMQKDINGDYIVIGAERRIDNER